MNVSRANSAENVFVIQPYISSATENSDAQLQEARALVKSISNWKVLEKQKVAMKAYDKSTLFDAAQLEHLRNLQLSHHSKVPNILHVYVPIYSTN